jgi:flagellar hook-associated protein 2
MTISSTSGSTSKTSSSLDVAGIVSGLMEAENVPVTKLDAKISTSSVKITALGQIKSQLSMLKSALIDLQTPANFTKQSAKFSNTSAATADISTNALAGRYQMEVTSLAQPAIWNITGFTDEQSALDWYISYAPDAVRNSSQHTVFKSDDGEFVLSLQVKDDSGLFGYTNSPPSTPKTDGFVTDPYTDLNDNVLTLKFDREQPFSNALFKLNGIEFTRSSNTISDALTGITLNLNTTTSDPITLTVTNEPVSVKPKLDAMVNAYNNLYATYKQQTASSIDPSSRGILNSDFALASVMRQLVSGLMLPIKNNIGGTLDMPNDLSAMGIKLLDNGNLALDDDLYSAASGTLQTRVSAGIRIGFSGSTDLSSQIGDMLLSGGVIQDRIDSETNTQSELNKRKTTLQDKLVVVQARYIAQYAALDALLFKLQGTSDSLKSALDGLANSQKSN